MKVRERQVRIFGSITSIELATLGQSAHQLLDAGVDGLHIDLADGVFVPDLTFGPRIVDTLRRITSAVLDVHLMVIDPERLIPAVAAAGANRISFHLESTRYPWRIASLISRESIEAGVALNPVSPLAAIEALGDSVGFANLLTTDPDLDGERLLPRMAERVAAARALLPEGTAIEVDGGLNASNIGRLRTAGAADFVVGRAICSSPDWAAAVASLRTALAHGGGDEKPDTTHADTTGTERYDSAEQRDPTSRSN